MAYRASFRRDERRGTLPAATAIGAVARQQVETTMQARLALLVLLVTTTAAAAQVPKLAVDRSCKAAAAQDPGNKETYKSCMADEEAARARLAKEWRTYRASDRSDCLNETRQDNLPSYVELMECLAMAVQARQSGEADKSMPQGKPARAPKTAPAPQQ